MIVERQICTRLRYVVTSSLKQHETRNERTTLQLLNQTIFIIINRCGRWLELVPKGSISTKRREEKREMKSVLTRSTWIKNTVVEIQPNNNLVLTGDGKDLIYDYLVVALGLQLRYDLMKGLPRCFSTPGVCSNYHKDYFGKTLKSLESFTEGDAIFTIPDTSIKCAGAPQKIMHLADQYFRKKNVRDKATLTYNTSLGVIFGVKKYADALEEICRKRNLKFNSRHVLTEVKSKTKEAVFNIKDAQNNVVGVKTFPVNWMNQLLLLSVFNFI